MSIHPDITQKMRAEVLQHCGPHAKPTFDQIHQLRYSKSSSIGPTITPIHLIHMHSIVRAVINETMRLFPPVPLNLRETRSSPCLLPPSDPSYAQDNAQLQPLFVPANTVVTYLPLLTQRNPALWGPDADEFKPERWLNPETQAKCNSNIGMFMPFSHGPRIVRVLYSFALFTRGLMGGVCTCV